jgi:hypothetical protein
MYQNTYALMVEEGVARQLDTLLLASVDGSGRQQGHFTRRRIRYVELLSS